MLSKECLRNILQKHRNHTEDLRKKTTKFRIYFLLHISPILFWIFPFWFGMPRSSLEAFLQRQVESKRLRSGEPRAAAQRLGSRLRSWQVRCFFVQEMISQIVILVDMLDMEGLKYVVFLFCCCFLLFLLNQSMICWYAFGWICFFSVLFQMVLKSEGVFRLALVPLEGVARCLCGESDLPEDLRLSSKNTWLNQKSDNFKVPQSKFLILLLLMDTFEEQLASPWEMQENWCQTESRWAVLR